MKSAILYATHLQDEMNSAKPKVMQEIMHRSLLSHMIHNLNEAGIKKIAVICKSDIEIKYENVICIKKDKDFIDDLIQTNYFNEGNIVIVNADMPLLKSYHLLNTEGYVENSDICVIKSDRIKNVVKDTVRETINNLKDYPLISMDEEETIVVINHFDLLNVSEIMKMNTNMKLISQGVQIIDPQSTYIDDGVFIGQDSVIEPNVHLIGDSVVGSNTRISANSYIINSSIGDNCVIDSSKISDSHVGSNSTIGPFAHIRNQTYIEGNARIGNFVEFKNTNFGLGSKCAHLTYIGDSDVGKNVNFGCGVVTVNYDGKHKYRTVVNDGAFVGSNVNLIAPVTIGKNALLAAGSTITGDVNEGDMAIARSRQSIKTGYGDKFKNK